MKTEVTISATELKVNLGKYLQHAAEGQTFMIQKHGANVAVLISPGFHAQEYLKDATETSVKRTSEPVTCQAALSQETVCPYQSDHRKMSYDSFRSLNYQTEQRMEYINGEVFMLASPGVVHQIVSDNLFLQFSQALIGKPCRAFTAPFDINLPQPGSSNPSVCQPDLLIACDFMTQMDEKGRYTGLPSLVVEILSDTTRSKDLFLKLQIYLRAGIREYWIIEPSNRSVMVYWVEEDGSEHFRLHTDEEVITSHVFPNLSVPLTEIWRQVP